MVVAESAAKKFHPCYTGVFGFGILVEFRFILAFFGEFFFFVAVVHGINSDGSVPGWVLVS